MDQFTMLVNYFVQSDEEKLQGRCSLETTDSMEFVEQVLLECYNIQGKFDE